MNYVNPDLTRLARLVPCCMSCGRGNQGDVVAAHSNQLRDGKGRSIKAHDFRIAFMCGECHSDLDQGTAMSREQRVAVWEDAHRATIGWLFTSGHLKVLTVAAPHINPERADKPSRPIPKGPKLQGRSSFPTGRTIPKRPWPKKADRT